MKKLTISIAAAVIMIAAPANAADMPRRHVKALSPSVDAMATQLAHYRAIAKACRPSDGTVLNKAFWQSRLMSVPANQRALFNQTVLSRSAPEIAALSGFDSPLKCDDVLDRVEDQFPAISGPEGAGVAAEPICWSDVTMTNACDGIGDDDILAGVDPLLAGY